MRFLISLVIANLTAGPALSCGNPLLWAMLFAAVPQAEAVYDADLAAREEGVLAARVFDAKAGADYHKWSMQWIKNTASRIDDRIQPTLPAGETYSLLLADAVVAIHFVSGKPPRVISPSGLDVFGGFDAITTVNALESGLNHGVTMSEMVELGVWVPQARATERRLAGIF